MKDKLRLVAKTAEPGARVRAVAARHGVCESLLFTWRRQVRDAVLRAPEMPVFIPIQVLDTLLAMPGLCRITTRVLLIGIKPEAVGVSDPDLPLRTTPEKIPAGIDATLSDMKARGWEGAFCSILPDGSAEATFAMSLAERWDCILIGGGIHIPSRSLPLFERVINAVHRGAGGTPIAFNTSPNDTANAAARWLDGE